MRRLFTVLLNKVIRQCCTLSIKNDQLDDLERKIAAEERQMHDLTIENELLFDYWVTWSNFNLTILDWIRLKKVSQIYQKELRERELPPINYYCEHCGHSPIVEEVSD